MTDFKGSIFDIGRVTIRHGYDGRATQILAGDGTELRGIKEIDYHADHQTSTAILTVELMAIELEETPTMLRVEEATLVAELRRRGYKVEIDDSDVQFDLDQAKEPAPKVVELITGLEDTSIPQPISTTHQEAPPSKLKDQIRASFKLRTKMD